MLIEKKKTETIEADSDLHVKGNLNEKVDAKLSLTVGGDLHEKVGMNYAHESGMTVYIKAGMTLVLEAGMQLSLKVGGSFIDINPTGVAISGPMVLINSGGAAGSGQAPQPTEPTTSRLPGVTRPPEPFEASCHGPMSADSTARAPATAPYSSTRLDGRSNTPPTSTGSTSADGGHQGGTETVLTAISGTVSSRAENAIPSEPPPRK